MQKAHIQRNTPSLHHLQPWHTLKHLSLNPTNIDTIIYAAHSPHSGISLVPCCTGLPGKRRLLQGQHPWDRRCHRPKLRALDGGHYGRIGGEVWGGFEGQTWLREKGTQQKCQQTTLANQMTTNVIHWWPAQFPSSAQLLTVALL